YWEKAKRAKLPVDPDFGEFWRALEWMGLQRHLKVLDIFARINYRDGKPKYLPDTPRFLAYARPVAQRYRELAPLNQLLDEVEAERRCSSPLVAASDCARSPIARRRRWSPSAASPSSPGISSVSRRAAAARP